MGVPGEQALGCYISNGQIILWSDGWHDPAAGVVSRCLVRYLVCFWGEEVGRLRCECCERVLLSFPGLERSRVGWSVTSSDILSVLAAVSRACLKDLGGCVV